MALISGTKASPESLASPKKAASASVTARERFYAIQGLRAWAMLFVFGYHLHAFMQMHWPNAFSRFVLASGGWGSNTFLCISGFFLHRSLSRRPVDYLDYLRKRFLRLYPVYACILTLVLALDIVLRLGRTGVAGRWSDLPLVIKNYLMLPVFLREKPILDMSWTLAYIAAFSVAVPFVSGWVRGRRVAARLAIIGAVWAASWIVLPPRATLMLAGMFVWEVFSLRYRWWGLGAIAAAMLAVGAQTRIALVPLILLIVLAGPEPLRRGIGHPLMQRLGDRSYSFYLAHGLPVLAAAVYVFPHVRFWQAIVLQPVVLVAALLFSECVYRWVEARFRA